MRYTQQAEQQLPRRTPVTLSFCAPQENRVRLREQQRRQKQNERMREKVKNEIILKVGGCPFVCV